MTTTDMRELDAAEQLYVAGGSSFLGAANALGNGQMSGERGTVSRRPMSMGQSMKFGLGFAWGVLGGWFNANSGDKDPSTSMPAGGIRG